MAILWLLFSLFVGSIAAILSAIIIKIVEDIFSGTVLSFLFDPVVEFGVACMALCAATLAVAQIPSNTKSGKIVTDFKERRAIYTEELKKDIALYDEIPDFLVERVDKYNAEVLNLEEDFWTSVSGFSKEEFIIGPQEHICNRT